jgi:hypothetical protein
VEWYEEEVGIVGDVAQMVTASLLKSMGLSAPGGTVVSKESGSPSKPGQFQEEDSYHNDKFGDSFVEVDELKLLFEVCGEQLDQKITLLLALYSIQAQRCPTSDLSTLDLVILDRPIPLQSCRSDAPTDGQVSHSA